MFECSGICVMNADGAGKRILVPGSGEGVLRQPAWSPDDRKIAFVRQMNDTGLYAYGVVTKTSSGGTLRVLAPFE